MQRTSPILFSIFWCKNYIFKADNCTSSDVTTFAGYIFFIQCYFYRIVSILLKTAAGFYPLPPSYARSILIRRSNSAYMSVQWFVSSADVRLLKEVKHESHAVVLRTIWCRKFRLYLHQVWKFIMPRMHRYITAKVDQWSYTEICITVVR